MRTFFVAILMLSCVARAEPTSRPVRPGSPEAGLPFWNTHALRFIFAPSFDLPAIAGATHYRFAVTDHQGKSQAFEDASPRAALSPVWEAVVEGYTTLDVQGLDDAGKAIGEPAHKVFYRSPGFSAGATDAGDPARFKTAGRSALKAIFEAPHVQAWLKGDGKPDPTYARYCYPNKVIGGLVRAMAAYARVAESQPDRETAERIGRRAADYLLSIRYAEGSPYSGVPPTYALNVRTPTNVTAPRVRDGWLLVPSVVDSAFGFFDLYDLTKDAKYLDAARAVADALARTQESDGTWPLMVDYRTGKPVAPQRLIPTWPIFFFDRFDEQYHVDARRDARARAWKWTVDHPLKTYQWDAQFEDIQLRGPYENLAREQACDVAVLLMSGEKPPITDIAKAEELLRFAEDQFVAWAPVADVDGWKRAMPHRRKNCEAWITPCVLEQYACYDPVARSSAVLINAYLCAAKITGKLEYLAKARALGDGMLAGQAWLAKEHDGNSEIPTWNMKRPPINWLNNSYYAADAILNLARRQQQGGEP